MKRSQAIRTQAAGSVLIVVLVIAGILAITGTGLLSLSLGTYRRAVYTSQEIAARCAAEAGAAKALFAMKSYDGIHLPSATNESVPECSGTFSYTVTAGTPDGYVVDATGTAGSATKAIHARLTGQSSLFCGLTLSQSAIIKTSAQVLPATGSSSPKLLTNSTTAGAVNLEAATIVFHGDVVVGPGGNPATVIVGEQVVSGTISAASAATTFPAITPPTGLTYRGSIGGTTTITQDGWYDAISVTGSSKQVTIQGNRTLYVTGPVGLYNSARIIVAANSSLTLYVGGNITLDTSSSFRETAYDPTKVLILGTSSCASIHVSNWAKFYGGLYAPSANLHFQAQAEIHGAFACRTLDKMETSAKLYYDSRLQNVQIPGSAATSYCISYWQDN